MANAYEHMGNNILWDLQHTMQKEIERFLLKGD